MMQFDLTLRRDTFCLQASMKELQPGITVLAGASGAGKTSLLRVIAGLDRAQGYLQLKGRVLQNQASMVPPHRRMIGYMTQRSDLFPHMRVCDNLAFARHFAPANGIDQKALIEATGVSELLHRYPHTLSGGQQQRVALARTMLGNPSLLLLDEPFASLDEEAANSMARILRHLVNKWQLPCLLVTHDFGSLVQLADQIWYIKDGKIAAHGASNHLLCSDDLPFSHRDDASVIWQGQVLGENLAHGLLPIKVGSQVLMLPGARKDLQSQEVRLRIRASDVSLRDAADSHSSILNVLAVQVRELRYLPQRPGEVLALLEMETQPLLCRITEKSAREMNLQAGNQLFAQIKATTLRR